MGRAGDRERRVVQQRLHAGGDGFGGVRGRAAVDALDEPDVVLERGRVSERLRRDARLLVQDDEREPGAGGRLGVVDRLREAGRGRAEQVRERRVAGELAVDRASDRGAQLVRPLDRRASRRRRLRGWSLSGPGRGRDAGRRGRCRARGCARRTCPSCRRGRDIRGGRCGPHGCRRRCGGCPLPAARGRRRGGDEFGSDPECFRDGGFHLAGDLRDAAEEHQWITASCSSGNPAACRSSKRRCDSRARRAAARPSRPAGGHRRSSDGAGHGRPRTTRTVPRASPARSPRGR
jgi:hypothetical protein